MAANLGVVTGKHLAGHCRFEYSKVPNFILWILAEIAVIACDIPEVIGTAFALNMLFKIPVWAGVLLTGLSTLVLLALQKYGVRKLEFLIAFLVLTIAACFLAELGHAKPKASEVLYGLFVPQLEGNGAAGLAISLLGAMVMPHNLFLHSALVLSRKIPRSSSGIKEACRYYMIESGIALAVAFLINVSVKAVSGAVCSSPNLNLDDQNSSKDLDLNKASFLLRLSAITWVIGSLIMGIDIYFIAGTFIKLLSHSKMKLVAVIYSGIFGVEALLIYLAAVAYLVIRKNRENSQLLSLTTRENQQMPREDIVSMQLPQRRSNADVE